ncbi:MAG: hypothetical protein NVSMB1_05150 [Polyangiales bacterium]
MVTLHVTGVHPNERLILAGKRHQLLRRLGPSCGCFDPVTATDELTNELQPNPTIRSGNDDAH